jgi:hypothetical protein
LDHHQVEAIHERPDHGRPTGTRLRDERQPVEVYAVFHGGDSADAGMLMVSNSSSRCGAYVCRLLIHHRLCQRVR